MTKNRLEAFSDGVLAIIITIMVLELRPPADISFSSLRPLIPKILSYIMSFALMWLIPDMRIERLLEKEEETRGGLKL